MEDKVLLNILSSIPKEEWLEAIYRIVWATHDGVTDIGLLGSEGFPKSVSDLVGNCARFRQRLIDLGYCSEPYVGGLIMLQRYKSNIFTSLYKDDGRYD